MVIINNILIELVGVDGSCFPMFWSRHTQTFYAQVEPNTDYFVRVGSNLDSRVCCRILVDDHSLGYHQVLEARQVRDLGLYSVRDGKERHQPLTFPTAEGSARIKSPPCSFSVPPSSAWGGHVRVEFYEAKQGFRREVPDCNLTSAVKGSNPDFQRTVNVGSGMGGSTSADPSTKPKSVWFKTGSILAASAEIRYCTSAGLTLAGIRQTTPPKKMQWTLREVIDLTGEEDVSAVSVEMNPRLDVHVDENSHSDENAGNYMSIQAVKSGDVDENSTRTYAHDKPLSSKEIALLRSMYQKKASHKSRVPISGGHAISKQKIALLRLMYQDKGFKKTSCHNQDRVRHSTKKSPVSVMTNESNFWVSGREAIEKVPSRHDSITSCLDQRDDETPKVGLQTTPTSPQTYYQPKPRTSQMMKGTRTFPGYSDYFCNASSSMKLSNFSRQKAFIESLPKVVEEISDGRDIRSIVMKLPELAFEKVNGSDVRASIGDDKETNGASQANEMRAWLGSWSESMEE